MIFGFVGVFFTFLCCAAFFIGLAHKLLLNCITLKKRKKSSAFTELNLTQKTVVALNAWKNPRVYIIISSTSDISSYDVTKCRSLNFHIRIFSFNLTGKCQWSIYTCVQIYVKYLRQDNLIAGF